MRIGLVDVDGRGFPNLALMKLAAVVIGFVPFAQPYRDFSGDAKPSREAWRLTYWCNNKRLFNAMDFADYTCK